MRIKSAKVASKRLKNHASAQDKANRTRMLRLNEARTDFLDKFQRLIDGYNAGSRNIEEVYRRLIELTKALSEEEERHIRENLTEEELAVFDILTRPGPELTAEEREEVKKVSRQLLARIHSLLGLDWRKKNHARARVQMAIEARIDDNGNAANDEMQHRIPGYYCAERHIRLVCN
jgi:type I restriction enzyme R subunit